MRYSFWNLLHGALRGHNNWRPAWREASLRSGYDVIVVGGGGHGLATAYYLLKQHGARSVAVLEKGWIGGGNSGRNTQVVRSNYFFPESCAFYDHSLRLYEGLSRELNFNVMLSQRGMLILAHTPHDLDVCRRRLNAMVLNGIDARLLAPAEILERVPSLNFSGRYPVLGGLIQARAGISRHDAVVWGYARAASALGADIVQNCEVLGFLRSGDRVTGVETQHGPLHADHVVLATAGNSSVLAARAGLRLPITTMALQAMVTEPVKPTLNTVMASLAFNAYISQTDRGEIVIGGAADGYNSYAQRGSVATLRHTVRAALEMFPAFERLRMMRQWSGAVDITPDASPIMGLTPLSGLYLDCGWGTGGYKAIPAGGETLAFTVAKGAAHPLIRSFSLERFMRGALVPEGAAAGVAH